MNNLTPSRARRIGKLGGKSKSPAKLAAVRANGRKGGRPRKHPAAWIKELPADLAGRYG